MNNLPPDWFKSEKFYAFLSENLPSQEFKVYPLAGDASNRRYYRAVCDHRSWVLMRWEPFEDNGNYPFLSVLRHFKSNKVHVPEVLAISEKQGLILLEDLGDLTLERKFWESQNQTNITPFYRLAIDELIKIHFIASSDKKPCTAFKVKFDHDKFLWEMNFAKTHFFEGQCGIELSDSISRSLNSEFSDICKKLDDLPKFISHRDYHSRNLMIKYDQLKVIDFQDARLGPIQYDLVSLFRDSYVELNKNIIDELKKYYIAQMSEHTELESPEEFEYFYELQSIQRCFKACGSFASFMNTRGDTRYLKYLKKTIHQVCCSLENLNEYPTFKSILLDNNLSERNYL